MIGKILRGHGLSRCRDGVPAPGCRARERGRSFATCRRAATAVEFAILAPLLFILLLGVVEVGRLMWIQASLQFAVEEAARYAMVNVDATTSAIETYAQNQLAGLSPAGITFVATQDTTGGNDYMTISASYNFTVIANIVPLDPITISTSSRVPLIP